MLPAIPPAPPFHSRTVESFSPVFEPRGPVEPGQPLLLLLPKALVSSLHIICSRKGKVLRSCAFIRYNSETEVESQRSRMAH